MANETIQLITQSLTYESVTQITNNPIFLIATLVVWLLPLIMYLIIGFFAKARSPSGQILSRRMIEYPNFFYAFALWFFLQSALFLLLIIFPFWINWIPQ